MSEVPHRSHALESFLDQWCAVDDTQAGVRVHVQPALDYVNLRGRPEDAAFTQAVESILQQSLPVRENTWTSGLQTIYWLGPDEWLVVAEANSGIYKRLCARLDNHTCAVTPQHGGLIQMGLSGEAAGALLAKGCTIDLHPSTFPVGQCAQTGLAKASVLVALTDNKPSFNLIVRRSFAEYIALWLAQSGGEFGINFWQR